MTRPFLRSHVCHKHKLHSALFIFLSTVDKMLDGCYRCYTGHAQYALCHSGVYLTEEISNTFFLLLLVLHLNASCLSMTALLILDRFVGIPVSILHKFIQS